MTAPLPLLAILSIFAVISLLLDRLLKRRMELGLIPTHAEPPRDTVFQGWFPMDGDFFFVDKPVHNLFSL